LLGREGVNLHLEYIYPAHPDQSCRSSSPSSTLSTASSKVSLLYTQRGPAFPVRPELIFCLPSFDVLAILNTFYAATHTVYSIVSTVVTAAWSIIAGVLRTTFNVSEATIEGLVRTFIGIIDAIWVSSIP
jgi:hypothetical protein